MKKSLPKTKEDCFAQLDAALSKEDKEELLKGDAAGFHFSLGLWLRNNWLHKMSHIFCRCLGEHYRQNESRRQGWNRRELPVGTQLLP